MTTINIPESPRTDFVHHKAVAFLGALRTIDFPLNPLTALHDLGVATVTYQDIINNCHIPYEHLVSIGNSKDGFSRYVPALQRYGVAYEDRIRTRERINWTLAHELGHIVLGHFTDFPQARLDSTLCNSRGLSARDAYVLDREADTFASDFLAPAGLIYWIANSYDLCTPVFYFSLARNVFYLSRQAAYFTSCNIEKDHHIVYRYALYWPIIKKFQPIFKTQYIHDRQKALDLSEASEEEYNQAKSLYQKAIS